MPDVLLHMKLSAEEAEGRGGFGEERYEVSEFQAKVKDKVNRSRYYLETALSGLILAICCKQAHIACACSLMSCTRA